MGTWNRFSVTDFFSAYLHGDAKARILRLMKRLGVVAILILAFLGLADSLYLVQHAASGTPLLCNIQDFSGCNIVAASQYARIFGIPLAEFGVVFYGVLFILAALELVLVNRLLRRLLQAMALIGILASLYFIFLQLFVIDAVCIYCVVSALITLFILIFASFIEPLKKRIKPAIPPPQNHSQLSMPPNL